MANNGKKLTKEQLNAMLRRPIQDGRQYDNLVDKPARTGVKLQTANTFYSVAMIKKYVHTYHKQVARLAPVLKGATLEQTCKNIHVFLLNNVQYQIDYLTQHIRTPANTWANRQAGVECKNFSLFASAVLTNLGVTHYIRQIKYTFYKPKQFTHVYLVVPINQETGDLKDGYYVIDATSRANKEGSIKEKNDTIMNDKLPHVGLNGAIIPVKKLKNNYITVLQQNNGFGWDDLEVFKTNSTFSGMTKKDKEELKRLKVEYKIAQPRSRLRVINRKIPVISKGLNAARKPARKPATRTKKQFPFN